MTQTSTVETYREAVRTVGRGVGMSSLAELLSAGDWGMVLSLALGAVSRLAF